mmetsp:Transcript_16194/g.35171  ORF Transcript_16194/g.35171 Transcript_16194/m.35171 type:complete len:526 (+) Transcript_16194:701-2278(+)
MGRSKVSFYYIEEATAHRVPVVVPASRCPSWVAIYTRHDDDQKQSQQQQQEFAPDADADADANADEPKQSQTQQQQEKDPTPTAPREQSQPNPTTSVPPPPLPFAGSNQDNPEKAIAAAVGNTSTTRPSSSSTIARHTPANIHIPSKDLFGRFLSIVLPDRRFHNRWLLDEEIASVVQPPDHEHEHERVAGAGKHKHKPKKISLTAFNTMMKASCNFSFGRLVLGSNNNFYSLTNNLVHLSKKALGLDRPTRVNFYFISQGASTTAMGQVSVPPNSCPTWLAICNTHYDVIIRQRRQRWEQQLQQWRRLAGEQNQSLRQQREGVNLVPPPAPLEQSQPNPTNTIPPPPPPPPPPAATSNKDNQKKATAAAARTTKPKRTRNTAASTKVVPVARSSTKQKSSATTPAPLSAFDKKVIEIKHAWKVVHGESFPSHIVYLKDTSKVYLPPAPHHQAMMMKMNASASTTNNNNNYPGFMGQKQCNNTYNKTTHNVYAKRTHAVYNKKTHVVISKREHELLCKGSGLIDD